MVAKAKSKDYGENQVSFEVCKGQEFSEKKCSTQLFPFFMLCHIFRVTKMLSVFLENVKKV